MFLIVVTKTGSDHKRPQTITNHHKSPTNNHKTPPTTTNHQEATTNDHRRLQNTNIRLQTTNKRTLTTSKRRQIATPAHQIKCLTFRFFFLHQVIYKEHSNFGKHSLQCQISAGVGRWMFRVVGRGPTKVSSINKRGVVIKGGSNKNILI